MLKTTNNNISLEILNFKKYLIKKNIANIPKFGLQYADKDKKKIFINEFWKGFIFLLNFK